MNAGVEQPARLDAADLALIRATQAGLPLVPQPYHALGEALGMAAAEVMSRLQRMLACGIIRRIGAVPNHYALGYVANGMTVWDVDDARVDELGERIGRLPFVSHCYRRPRHLPMWPYNLFAMVHGKTVQEVVDYVAEIETLLGRACRAHDILYSSQILKKTGLRLRCERDGHQGGNREDVQNDTIFRLDVASEGCDRTSIEPGVGWDAR